MITEQDLHEAIAECEGERNPNANTCIKLAAFYTILDHMFRQEDPEVPHIQYSYSGESDDLIKYDGKSEFARSINGIQVNELLDIMDELMSTLAIVQPRLYASVMRKIQDPVL